MSVQSVAIFESGGHHAALERSLLRALGVPKHDIVPTEAALFEALSDGRDLVLINWTAAWDDVIALVRAIRSKDKSPDPFVSVIIVSPALNAANAAAAMQAGVNSLMRMPFSAADIQRQLAIVSAPVRFIDAPKYFGPDRRKHETEVTPELEARVGAPCRIIAGEMLDAVRTKHRESLLSVLDPPRAAS